MFGTTKLATAAVAGVLSLAVTGAAAFAAFQPPAETAILAATDAVTATAVHAEKDGDGLRAVLARLVQNGTLTQAQADAILGALKQATEEKKKAEQEKKKDRDGDHRGADVLKLVLGNMLKLSVGYIGLPHEAVAAQLKAGKSLGEIAATQPGKSREGLIAHVEAQVSAQLDKAVAEGKITAARAGEFKADLTERVTKFVDHKYERKPAQPKERKPVERGAKKPAASPSAKPTT